MQNTAVPAATDYFSMGKYYMRKLNALNAAK